MARLKTQRVEKFFSCTRLTFFANALLDEVDMLQRITLMTLLTTLVLGCQRAPRQVLEDSKTASRHVGRAFESLGGKGGKSRQVKSQEAFGLPDSAFDAGGDEGAGDLSLDAEDASIETSRYRQTSASPGDQLSSLPGIEAFCSPSGALLSVFTPIYFETDRDLPKSERDRQQLVTIAQYLKKNQRVFVYIEGHCDERGTASYNLSLGSRRSNSIRKRLIDLGVPADQLFTISFGKERPRARGRSEVQWRQNRRVEFKIFDQRST